MPTESQITVPAELAARLSQGAQAMGLDLPAYLIFLEQAQRSQHDAAFRDSVRFLFTKYSETLKRLA